MIIAVGDLSRAAWIDDVELRSDLIRRAEPRFAHERDHRIAVIGRKHGRVAQAQLLERVPDPVVRARLGEMIAAADIAQALFVDDRPEMRIGLVDRREVGERAADDDDARSVGQRLDPFRHQFLARFGRSRGAARLEAVVDGHVRRDVAGEGIVSAIGGPLHELLERIEVARVRREPHSVGPQAFGVVVLHWALPPCNRCWVAV